ncbi:hypothetical protein C4A42_04162 [Escherichia coli]|nr:hypothetical protein C4A42_04162 [Escherichia coli]
MTAAAKRTLASLPARLRWRHGTARTRHGGHITENPQGHAPHGRVKRSRRRLPLCSVRDRQEKGGDFPRHHQPLIFARASATLRISARASRTTSRRTQRSNHRRGGSSGIRSTSQASPLDRICSIQSLTRYISTAEKRAPRFRMASSTTGRFSSSSSSQQG